MRKHWSIAAKKSENFFALLQFAHALILCRRLPDPAAAFSNATYCRLGLPPEYAGSDQLCVDTR
jgi:hypothetical protein